MREKNELVVIRAGETTGATAQTTGMQRAAAISRDSTGAERIWMGRVVGNPGMDSGPHHHGEAESAVYVVSGQARILYGENFSEHKDIGPGDFVFIPAFLPHIERNVSDEPVVVVLARSPDNIVVNLDD